ncbi:hypothetical protein [uncultured Eubacterium sp.]|uniref:hypothetical protein n=1 Tax=uncultured Eubacterium sp. TaxID=165185 RepID=UPI00258EA9FA|nr:hypothetical protein [uncultured Eubacterium sp.]
MKKFIKKTIAGLIAGVMAISSMPFTALAAEPTALEQAKTALNNFNYTAPTGDYGSFNEDNQGNWAKGTGYTTYMRNVLYGEKGTAEDQGKVIDNKVSATIHYPQMVLLYDGVKENYLDIPVMSTAQGTATRYIYSAVNENNEFVFTQPEHWYGEDVKFNWAWLYSNQITKKAGNSFWGDAGTMGTTDSQTSYYSYIKNGNGNGNWYKWANMYRFVGGFEDGTFTKSVCPKLTFYAGSSSTYNYNDIKFTCEATKPIYFINYKAVRDRITEAKAKIATVNYDEYTKESVDAYAQAVMGLVNLDKNFGFDEGVTQTLTQKKVADKVQLAERDIRNVVNAYDHATLVKVNKLKEEEYNAALATAKAEAAKTNEYTEASFKALTDEIAAVEEAKKTVTEQKDLDALTARLLTAVNNLNKKQLTVKLQVLPYGSETPVEKESKQIEYGRTYTSLEGAIGQNQNVKKWVVETNNGQTFTTLNTFDKVVDVVITEDTTIIANLSDDVVAPTSTKVTFLGRHNKVVAIKYVTGDEPFKTNTVDVPELPFYTSKGWDTETVVCDGKEHVVRATYKANENEKKCIVHFNNKEKAYTYNSYVYLFDAVKGQKYALYADEAGNDLLVVLDGVDFYTPQRDHIYVKEYTGDAEANVAVMGSFATTETSETDIKYVANFNCKFNIPADAKAVDWGVILENSKGVQKPISIKEKSERNEYTVRIKVSKKVKVNACAYVTYKKADGTNVTKKSGFVTVDLNTL